MKIYLAGLATTRIPKKLVPKVGFVLDSYFELQGNDWLNEFLANDVFDNFMLDSGAFSFMNSQEKVDWDSYVKGYIDFIRKYDVDKFFELDIERLTDLDRVEQLRDMIEQKTGKPVIPVWHPERRKDYWFKMVENYDYVALGGMAQETTIKYRNLIEKHFPWFIRTAHRNNAKIHALGYTSLPGLKKYGFDSVDSTSWVGAKYGKVWHFNGQTMIGDQRKNQRTIGYEVVNKKNLEEWIKFQRYADKRL